VQWLAPSLGIFRFSYGIALNPPAPLGSNLPIAPRASQFSIGQSF